MKLDLIHIICLIALAQCLLAALFFATNKKGLRVSNRILAAWLFVFAAMMGCYFVLSRGVWEAFRGYHKAILFFNQLSFLSGPLFYLYIKSLLEHDFRFKKRDVVHFAPFLLAVGYTCILLVMVRDFVIWRHPSEFFRHGAIIFINLFYILASLRLLHANDLSVKALFSYVDRSHFFWMRVLIGGYIVVWLVECQSFFIWIVARNGRWCTQTAGAYFMTTFVFFNTVIYMLLKKPDLYVKTRKYKNSILAEADKDQYKTRLIELMERKKPYLEPDLNLTHLARTLSIPPRYLSQVINESFGQNFYDFINSYRIKECKRLLADSNNGKRTILDIALACGFNTKTTFNTAFKKLTGQTPREFRKSLSPAEE